MCAEIRYYYPFIYIIKSNFVDFYVHLQLREVRAPSLAHGAGRVPAQCCLFQLSWATENFWSSEEAAARPISLLAYFHRGALSPGEQADRQAGRLQGSGQAGRLHCTVGSWKSGYRKMALPHLSSAPLRSANRFSVLSWSVPHAELEATLAFHNDLGRLATMMTLC